MATETTAALATIDASAALVLMENPPAAVLAEAQQAAQALQQVIASKPKKVIMGGEQYLEFEDWQTLGRFYGITAKEDGDPEYVEFGPTAGFKASAVALFRGEILSRATAYCLNDEEKWSSRPKYEWAYVKASGQNLECACAAGACDRHSVADPGRDELIWVSNPDTGKNRPLKEKVLSGEERVPLFQLSSMAQTRACAKALRNVLSWVVVMAGYRPTPAEELDGMATSTSTRGDVVEAERVAPAAQAPAQAQARAPQPARQAAPPSRPAAAQTKTRPAAGGKPSKCPRCGRGAVIQNKRDGHGYYCWPNAKEKGCGYKWDDGDEAIHAAAADERQASGEIFPPDDFQVSDDDVPF